MEDIQNGINAPGDSPMWDIAGKTIGGFKGAAVGANIRVVIQQPTAFFRAAAVLDLSLIHIWSMTISPPSATILTYCSLRARNASVRLVGVPLPSFTRLPFSSRCTGSPG